MRKLSSIFFALVLALVMVGCDSDSNDDELTDAEIFVGDWVVTGISDDTGDKTAAFGALVESLNVTFTDAATFLLMLNYRDDAGIDDLNLPGTYTLNADINSLILSIGGGPSPPFTYEIENEDAITLHVAAAFINGLFNPTTPYEGTVTIVVVRLD